MPAPSNDICKEIFLTLDELNAYKVTHQTFQCEVCNCEVSEDLRNKHKRMHENHDKQLKGVAKGKVTKRKVGKTS